MEDHYFTNITGITSRLIKEVGIPVDVKTDGCETPLMVAADNGKQESMKVLLQCGANPSLKDDKGCTAMDWAKQRNQLAIVAMMEDQ